MAVAVAQELADGARVGPHEQHERERDERDPARDQPGHGQRLCVELAVGEHRAEDGRAEHAADDGAGEDVGDAARPPGGDVHVAGGCTDEQRRRHADADQHEAREQERCRQGLGRERVQRTARGRGHEARREHRLAPEPVHRAAGDARSQARRGEEDRRSQPEQPPLAGHEHERDRRDGRGELQDDRVDRRHRGEDDGVAADDSFELGHGASLADPRAGASGEGGSPLRGSPPAGFYGTSRPGVKGSPTGPIRRV